MYNYETQKQKLFTDEGFHATTRTLQEAEEKLSESGAFRFDKLKIHAVDSFTQIAIIDYLVEKKYIKEVPTNGLTQHRIFTFGENR